MNSAHTRLFCLLLAAILIIGCIPMVGFAAENTTDFLGGDGSAENPYLISNATHLQNISSYPGAHFLLLTDIDLGGETISPIYQRDGAFSGTLDGGGHTISNATLRSSYNYRLGLFPINRGTIKNLRVENVDVYYYPSTYSYLGGITGENFGTITNCYVSGTVEGSSTYENGYSNAGGICGVNSGTVTDCHNHATLITDVRKGGYSAGIAAHNKGTVERCLNTGRITGSSWNMYCGGIVSLNSGTVADCQNTGYVGYHTSLGRTMHMGGIVADNTGSNTVITRCVNTGKVYYDLSPITYDGAYQACGEIVGHLYSGITLSNCYYLDSMEYTVGVGDGEDTATGCTVKQFMDPETFAGLDLENTWTFVDGDYKYPVLKAYADLFHQNISENTAEFVGGKGTAWDPYQIKTKEQLNAVRNYPDASFLLLNDITFSESDFREGGALYNESGYWQPIETFSGSFDGGGHTISGLSFRSDVEINEEKSGETFYLFGKNSGSIKNLTLSGLQIDISATVLLEKQHSSSIFGAGIVSNNKGQLVNCHVSGTVTTAAKLVTDTVFSYDSPSVTMYTSLLCCTNDGMIKGCSVDGKLSADVSGQIDCNRVWPDIYIAGICAYNYGMVDSCKSSVDMTVVTDQYVNARDITNESIHIYAGGIVGQNGYGSNIAKVYNCSSKGSISIQNNAEMNAVAPGYGQSIQVGMHSITYAGGIVGHNYTGARVERCMSSASVSETLTCSGKESSYCKTTLTMTANLGGIVGYNQSVVTNCYSTSDVTLDVSNSHDFDTENWSAGAGGVVGHLEKDCTLSECYSAGTIVSNGENITCMAGGCYALSAYNIMPKNVYALEGNFTGTASSYDRAVYLTPEQMLLESSFENFDFENIWCFDSSNGYAYPRLQMELGTLTKLEVLGDPGTLTTVEGLMPDVSHIQIRLTYSTGQVNTVNMDASFLSALDVNLLGTQTIPVSLRGVTADKELTVQINPKSTVGISVDETLERVYLNTDEQLNLNEEYLHLEYDNGTFDLVRITNDMLSPIDKTTPGTQLITVTYEGYTTTMAVEVYVASYLIVTYPEKTDYVQGQPLDLDRSIIQITYECGEKYKLKEFKTKDADSVEYDTQALGEVTVTVSKGGVSSEFVITVHPRQIIFVRLVQPTKLSYITGEELDLEGGFLTYIYESSDNYSENVPLTADMISGYDPNTPGFQTITVTAEGYTGTFMVRVIERTITGIELTTLPANLTYTEGTEAPDVSGGVLTVTYDDGATAEVALTADMVSGFDGSKAGIQTLTVTYKDFTASYDVTVTHLYIPQVTEPTCTESGFTTYSCACGDSYTDDITAPLGHVEIIDEGKEATCLEDGITEGSHCDRCGEVLVQQEIVPAKGHSWDDGVVTLEPTEESTGIRTYTCAACGQEKEETIPVLVHTHSYKTTVIAPTCTTKGYTKNVCECGRSYNTDFVDALGHSWGQWVETVKPDETRDGVDTRVCTACGETETKVIDNNIFTDVKKDRFEAAILWAYYNNITTGTGDGTTFSPENACTRKQIVTFLWRAAGEPEPKSMVNPFKDVKSDRFEKAILWAYYAGITSGTGDGSTFSPENTCTRKQIVTFLWRYNGQPAPKSMENKFVDVKNDRFTAAILWAAEQGITTGTGDGTTFSPEDPCTRKQIVTFLFRNLNKEEDK